MALALNADKLIVFTEADGLTGPDGKRISQMTPAELHNHVAAGASQGSGLPPGPAGWEGTALRDHWQ